MSESCRITALLDIYDEWSHDTGQKMHKYILWLLPKRTCNRNSYFLFSS